MQRSPLLLAGTELYRPLCSELKQFRLLTIFPGSFTEPVRCLLSAGSLDHETMPKYETISYAWGNRDNRSSITVNGAILSVPFSSMTALRRMRLLFEERVVWIDAVCINQSDLTERSAQVALMGIIYMRGQQNLIFLGDDGQGHAEAAVEALADDETKVSAAIEDLTHDKRELFVSDGYAPKRWMRNPILDASYRPAYEALYSLPWFR